MKHSPDPGWEDLESVWYRPRPSPDDLSPLAIDTRLVEEWLVEFLRDELPRRRGFRHVVVGLSGGVDSSLTASLAVRALGPEAVKGFLLPYRSSSQASRDHALELADWLGIETRTIDITASVDGYLEEFEPEVSDHRRGNVAARQRMRKQVGTAAGVFHMARRRLAPHQPARRPVQVTGLGALAGDGHTCRDRGQAGHG